MGSHSLLQGIFQTQRSRLHLLHWEADSLTLTPRNGVTILPCDRMSDISRELELEQLFINTVTSSAFSPLSKRAGRRGPGRQRKVIILRVVLREQVK